MAIDFRKKSYNLNFQQYTEPDAIDKNLFFADEIIGKVVMCVKRILTIKYTFSPVIFIYEAIGHKIYGASLRNMRLNCRLVFNLFSRPWERRLPRQPWTGSQ